MEKIGNVFGEYARKLVDEKPETLLSILGYRQYDTKYGKSYRIFVEENGANANSGEIGSTNFDLVYSIWEILFLQSCWRDAKNIF